MGRIPPETEEKTALESLKAEFAALKAALLPAKPGPKTEAEILGWVKYRGRMDSSFRNDIFPTKGGERVGTQLAKGRWYPIADPEAWQTYQNHASAKNLITVRNPTPADPYASEDVPGPSEFEVKANDGPKASEGMPITPILVGVEMLDRMGKNKAKPAGTYGTQDFVPMKV